MCEPGRPLPRQICVGYPNGSCLSGCGYPQPTQRGVIMIRLPKLVSVGVLIVMLGGSFAVAPSVAHSSSLELFAEPDYKARIGYRTTTGSWNISKGNNDTLSSVKNHTNWSAAFWYDAHQRGHCWDYSPKTDDPYFWWYDDNQASSFALGRGC
ncbi:hypothetical protein TICEST70_00635 [Cutibacterium acnes PRP-38]|nr:hypothetical protein TICEST70_00635 [Cutibacterium acnes PRP-38]